MSYNQLYYVTNANNLSMSTIHGEFNSSSVNRGTPVCRGV